MSKFEPDVRKMIAKYASGICADVGAGTGFHTIHMAERAEVKEVHAFEPIPYNIQKLRELNNPKIIVHPYALGSENGTLTLWADGEEPTQFPWVLGSIEKEKNPGLREPKIQYTVEVKRLDDVLSHVDFIKIDVEGMEYDVLLGGMEACREAYIIVEIHPFAPYKPKDIINLLKDTHVLANPKAIGVPFGHLLFIPNRGAKD